MGERRYSWSQPICADCYDRRHPDRVPVRLREPGIEAEICCDCGRLTRERFFYRVDPATVAYPTNLKDDD
jgi:hypothetical protein